jgi:DNA-binding GntR family transcriptional regulator
VPEKAVLSMNSVAELLQFSKSTRLQQDISPALIPADLARLLKVRPRTLALRILRHYYDSDGRILQISLGYYPEGRFSYNTRMRVQHHG